MSGMVLPSGSIVLPVMSMRLNRGMVGYCPSWLTRRRNMRRGSGSGSFSCSVIPECSPSSVQILDIIQNKVLIAAALSTAIGQFSKPFTSIILYGRRTLDFRDVFGSGGFPSTHSSAVVATATTLGLERGLSDSIFGLAAVYACLIMYDAQGVRREVGRHAKVINKLLLGNKLDQDSSGGNDDDVSKESVSASSFETKGLKKLESKVVRNASLLLESDARTQSVLLDRDRVIYVPLKESVGHTQTEVTAGALLGFLVALAVCSI